MTAPNVELVRHMQWWALLMAAEELAYADTGLPPAPPLSARDAVNVRHWLRACAEHISPGLRVDITFVNNRAVVR